MAKQIRFNAFEMNYVAHQSPGLWAHPRDRSWQYKNVDYWTDLAAMHPRTPRVALDRVVLPTDGAKARQRRLYADFVASRTPAPCRRNASGGRCSAPTSSAQARRSWPRSPQTPFCRSYPSSGSNSLTSSSPTTMPRS